MLAIWWQVGGDNQQAYANITGALFIILTNMFMGTFFGTLNVFQLERPVFLREQANQMYGLCPYFLTKNIVEQPILLLQPLITQLVVYWGVGFWNSEKSFWGMYLTLMLVGQCAAGLGFFISAACDSMQQASSVSSLITLPAILFGGLFVNDSTVFKALSWIQWLSPIRYGFEALCIAEFKPRRMEYYY